MGVNKVIYNNNTLIDITDTTAEQSDVLNGKCFYDSAGNRVVGALEGRSGDIKFKQGSFTLEEAVTSYAVSGLGFKPKLIIVSGTTLAQKTNIRTAYWLRNDYIGECVTYSYKSTSSSTTTLAWGTSYCVANDDGFTIKQYLELPIIPDTYSWLAFG